ANHARALDEVVHAERRREARAAAGRQHVIRPREVVAEGLGRVLAEEDRAGVPHRWKPALRARDGELEMLRRETVRDVDGLRDARRDERSAVTAERTRRDRPPWQCR